jgi:excisionase family DNA binding protein
MSSRKARRVQGRHLTTGEAAADLGVHERTVRRYISAGLLGYRRLPGGHYRIPEEAIREFWSAGGEETQQRWRRARSAQREERPRTGSAGAAPAGRATDSRREFPTREGSAVAYDLSPEVLAALREEAAAGDV